MEMQEKKKFMPTITNYLSDDDEEIDECLQISSNNSQLQANYAEWKKMQKSAGELSNGKKPRMRSDGSMEPLGDISSSDDSTTIEDNEPMFKIIKTLSDREAVTRRNQKTRKKIKEPSQFLLFSRMKHLKYQQSSQDWTFNELCRITHSSWENIQPSEKEELFDTMDQRISEYRDLLLKFRTVLLPDAAGKMKYKSWVSAAAANKEHQTSPVTNNLKDSPNCIPERLQNLVGKASVYHATPAPIKPNHNSRHSLYSYRSTVANNNDYSSETSLNYVANAVETCKYDSCTNRPVQDSRWDGQYCSAKCLINDCRDTFQNWLTDQKQSSSQSDEINDGNGLTGSGGPANGKASAATAAGGGDKSDEEIMQFLATPPAENNQSASDSEDSINRDENLFASLQQHYFPGENIIDLIRTNEEAAGIMHRNNRRFLTDIDEDDVVMVLSSPPVSKLRSNNVQNNNNQSRSTAVISSSPDSERSK